MTFEQAVETARVMAERGQRVWRVWRVSGPSSNENWALCPSYDGDAPSVLESTAAELCAQAEQRAVVYPTGLCLPVSRVNWVWHVPEERKYRLGNAEQAQEYAYRRGYASPIAVPPEYLHGCQVREDLPRDTYRFVTAVSFPHWCGV